MTKRPNDEMAKRPNDEMTKRGDKMTKRGDKMMIPRTGLCTLFIQQDSMVNARNDEVIK